MRPGILCASARNRARSPEDAEFLDKMRAMPALRRTAAPGGCCLFAVAVTHPAAEHRLAKLCLGEKTDAEMQERGRTIANESARYNLGAVQRTINNPVFALIFLQPEARTHFRFTMGKPDRKMGDNIRVVEYVEDMRPTLIVGLPGQDMPAYGRFWIESGTGRVVKSEVRVDQKGIKANLTT